MAGGSPHCSSSSSVPGRESPNKTPESPESPIIPFSHVDGIRNSPTRPVLPDITMADAPPAFPKPQGARSQLKTPEPRTSKERINGHRDAVERSPSTPGHLPPFDWEEFEARYQEAFADADRHEQELLKEFEDLVKFFNVWASAASVHDSERGVKRLQTRERYVKIAEQSLSQKKKHLTEVVRAFQSALALLSQT
ncbi:hypothetical protein C8A05DRAFT_43877 [Staphylotrichum tortipilum]|uniref:Uncharacterized protein n=1 Tax=Staphylotrichum tortipilum TaxID=2831512 RepID=A0AAN6RUN7_9PEZI|nr:hypothetical protein C8A05DRAFT_43877 [Staphylotrichum longicolle]